jgi:hypothetical protein
MAILVREADLQRDRDELITFLHENLTSRSNESRFSWLYLRNPSGQARAWIALDEATGQTMGLGAAFPRLVWFGGKVRRAWVLGDLCVAPGSRSLGPALSLQRVCLKSLAINENPIWFDFPSQPMLAIYRRLRIPMMMGSHVRFVKLLRVDEKVAKYIPGKSFARGISKVGNLMLRFQPATYCRSHGIEVSVHEGSFGEEFTELDSCTSNLHTIRGLRTAEYLNWRYRQNPFNQYRVAVAKRGTQLWGYAVAEMNGTNWILTDLHAIEEEKTIPCLLAYLGDLTAAFNVSSISIPIMEQAELVHHLQRAGFYPRESLPIVACVADVEGRPKNWFLMHGDRES